MQLNTNLKEGNMALFNQLSKKRKLANFQHKGWFLFCPIYIAAKDTDNPQLVERNGVPEWVFNVAMWVFQFNCVVMCTINPEFDPMFPILVTGELEK
jgi:hypothetical protein